MAGKHIAAAAHQIDTMLSMYNCSSMCFVSFFLTGVKADALAGGRSNAHGRGQRRQVTPRETLTPTTTAVPLSPPVLTQGGKEHAEKENPDGWLHAAPLPAWASPASPAEREPRTSHMPTSSPLSPLTPRPFLGSLAQTWLSWAKDLVFNHHSSKTRVGICQSRG